MSENTHSEGDFLTRAGAVLIALQLAIFAKTWLDMGFDRATDSIPIFIMCTGLFVSSHRRLLARPPNPGAGRWLFAARTTVLVMLTLGTLAIGINRFAPQVGAPPAFVPRGLFALMWAIIALKGAGIGKLKPGSAMGLCVPWTIQSRLAWDKGHRTLGRVLFWGGLLGLSASLVVAPPTTIVMWIGTVALAVTAALFESWRTWRLDPERVDGHAA